jgi:hypothetical protein
MAIERRTGLPTTLDTPEMDNFADTMDVELDDVVGRRDRRRPGRRLTPVAGSGQRSPSAMRMTSRPNGSS